LAFGGKLPLIYGNAVEILIFCDLDLQAGMLSAESWLIWLLMLIVNQNIKLKTECLHPRLISYTSLSYIDLVAIDKNDPCLFLK
jgi:hypothetical protein